MPYDVFISYAAADKPLADDICEVLEVNGIRCWIAPRDIKPGCDYGAEILSAIEASSAFLLVLSAHSNDSQHVKREVERAVSRNIPILPVRIEEVVPSKSLEYFICTFQWVDAFPPPLENPIRRLAENIKALGRKSEQPSTEPDSPSWGPSAWEKSEQPSTEPDSPPPTSWGPSAWARVLRLFTG